MSSEVVISFNVLSVGGSSIFTNSEDRLRFFSGFEKMLSMVSLGGREALGWGWPE